MAEYKIKDIEILTGIKAHTIRIWEKRYGMLIPERTDTKIRTYTDADLSFLLNISLLNKRGVKISKIATMGTEAIHNMVADIRLTTSVDNAEEKLILALLELDEQLFRNTLTDLINEKGLEATFTDHLIPFLDRIGVMWLVNSISAAQEHFISNLIRQKVISEIDKLPIPVKNKESILIFLPEHDWHEIGLLFYQYLLRSKGFCTYYLGQSLPYDSLIDCIERLQPTVVLSSWLTAVDEHFIVGYFKQLRNDAPQIRILAGGAQIHTHSAILKDLITEVKNAGSLLALFD
jgi:DNA-binding transcriptional MerR regulator/methylmalonyl-CoA mutase cobalamin-binding subunit